MSKTGLNFSKLISFNRLLDNSKKEKSINKSVSESSMLSDNDKDTKLNTLFKKFKKDKINRHQEGNNIHEKVNKDQKEANIQKSPNGSNNIQSTGESYQELIKLVPVTYVYEKNNIASEGLNTIFMAETYLKALPDYLPNELKRKTVLDIIHSSGMSADKLLKDGEERKKALNNFLQKFSQTTEKIIRDHENEIHKLSESIQANEKAITERKNLQEEQNALINYEVQRLQRIINFLQGESN